MVDIAARMLKAQIFIHEKNDEQKVIYQSETYSFKEIHIEYNGFNHFVALEPAAKIQRSVSNEKIKVLIFSGQRVNHDALENTQNNGSNNKPLPRGDQRRHSL